MGEMKKAVALLITMIITVTMAIAPIAMIASLISNENDKKGKKEEDVMADSLEEFKITGTYTDNDFKLKFEFDGWSIENVNFTLKDDGKDSVDISVQVPVISGEREYMAFQYLLRKGWTKEAACGLMANIDAESASSWRSNIEEGSLSEYQGETALIQGYGLCQWTNTGGDTHGRRYKVIQQVKSKGCDPAKDSDKAFLAEMEWAITEPGYEEIIKEMHHQTDPEYVADYWCRKWERPSEEILEATCAERKKRARKYYDKYKDKSKFGGGGSETEAQRLKFTYEIEGNEFTFNGTLGGTDIAGTFTFENGKCRGTGWFGEGATASGGEIGNPYGNRMFSITDLGPAYVSGHYDPIHYGWDLQAGGKGTKIHAVLAGTVVHAGSLAAYGDHVVIVQTGNLYTIYAHMSSMTVGKGDKVNKGQVVGGQGGEGSGGAQSYAIHLHLEFRQGSYSDKSKAISNWRNLSPMFQKWASNYRQYAERTDELLN